MQNAHIATRDSQRIINGNPLRYLNYLRDTKNATEPHRAGKIAWPTGKIEFASFVTRHGGRAPRSLAIILNGCVTAGVFGGGESVGSFLKRLPPGRYFCKPNRGAKGAGAFALDISDAGASVNGENHTLAAIEALLTQNLYIVQESLTPLQHSDIARFNPRTINTVRLITFDTETGPAMFLASLRIAIESVAVDNWSAGGVMVPIDLERGVLEEFGTIKKDLIAVDAHPQTRIKFLGQGVPYLREAAKMACLLHQELNLCSVGWDVAVLEDGPCIVEANSRWDVFMSALFKPDFSRTFLEFYLAPGTDAVRVELAGSFMQRDVVRQWLSVVMGAARVSARVDKVSGERLVVTVGGSRAAIENAMVYMRRLARDLCVREVLFGPAENPPLPGLDVSATFSS